MLSEILSVPCGTYEGVSFERGGKGTVQMIHLFRSYSVPILEWVQTNTPFGHVLFFQIRMGLFYGSF